MSTPRRKSIIGSTQLWQAELNRAWTHKLAFAHLIPPPDPVGFWRGRWNRLMWRVGRMRERLGEIIAGRRFSDDY